jgi:predicted chitinase
MPFNNGTLRTLTQNAYLNGFTTHFYETFRLFDIKKDMQQCFFLAQAAHETMSFKFLKERASGIAYEGREDLGNTTPGDGVKYKGRGMFQITGKFNYKRLSEYFKVDFINKPELLETPEWAAKSAGWFWTINNFNRFVSDYNFLEVTYRINGGYTHLDSRLTYLYRVLRQYKVVQPEVNILTNAIKKSAENIYLRPGERRLLMLDKVVKKDKFQDYFNKAISQT